MEGVPSTFADLSSDSAGWLLALILTIILTITCLYLPVLVSVAESGFKSLGITTAQAVVHEATAVWCWIYLLASPLGYSHLWE